MDDKKTSTQKVEMWKKRRWSYITVTFTFLCLACGGLFALCVIGYMQSVPCAQSLEQYEQCFFVGCISFGVLAVAFELFDVFRIPPSRWRVKAELTQLLIDEKFLPWEPSKIMIERDLRIKKMKWSPQAKTMTVDFAMSPSPSLARFKRLNTQSFRFKRVKYADFEDVREGDIFICYRMTLYYCDNSEREVSSPW